MIRLKSNHVSKRCPWGTWSKTGSAWHIPLPEGLGQVKLLVRWVDFCIVVLWIIYDMHWERQNCESQATKNVIYDKICWALDVSQDLCLTTFFQIGWDTDDQGRENMHRLLISWSQWTPEHWHPECEATLTSAYTIREIISILLIFF